MNSHTFQALGTQWWIEVFDEVDSKTLEAAFGSLERFTRQYEAKYSRFKSDSLVSKLNRERILKDPDEECRALLGYGKQLYLRTNTHFNFLTGHIQVARGYDASYSFIAHDPEKLTPGNPVTDLTISTETIELRHGNVDLGGYGKGYLIDELAALLKNEFFLQYFVINGGGDIFVTSKNEEPVEIYLEHPTEPGKFIEKTILKDHGFAASSPFKRIWHTDSKTYSHIITNAGVPQVASFVKATTTRDADAFATTALLLGEPDLTTLAHQQSFSVARFDPTTGRFWYTKDFSS